MMPFNGMQTFKIHEVARLHLDVALGGDTSIVFMSKQSYDRLPPQAKAAIDKHSGLALSRRAGQATQNEWERARDNVKDTVSTLTPTRSGSGKPHWSRSARNGRKPRPTARKCLMRFAPRWLPFAAADEYGP
jgi:TRAP-type C4-dicarboxylate transport system substrate-binding protein